MPMPVRALPVVQRWDCHSCGQCCRSYAVRVTEVERARIEAQKWGEVPGFEGAADAVVWDAKSQRHLLGHRPDGDCVFLGADSRCRIHAKFGAAGKPMACRIYPFVMVPAGDHWRVSLRLACPSAVGNSGRPVAAHLADLQDYAALLEADAGGISVSSGTHALPPPELQPGHAVPWADLFRFAGAFSAILADDSTPVDHRLRRLIAVAELCKKSRFETISGSRLGEFLEVITAAVSEDVPTSPAGVPAPGWLGRVLFRQVVALTARKDEGPDAGVAPRGRLTRLRAAWSFAAGRGAVPRLHAQIPATTFEAHERPAGPLPADSEALLARFYTLKIESLQFCGPTNHGLTFWAGLDALVLTYPVIRWLARAFAADGRRAVDDAVRLAVQLVDDNFGFNPLFGTRHQGWAVRTLAERGELARLVARYAR